MTWRPSDIIAAATPAAASLSLGEVNSLLGICGTLLGSAYLVWRWRRESRQKTP